MSVGPMGMAGSSAGSQLAQSHGTEVNRSQQETSDQARQLETTKKAEKILDGIWGKYNDKLRSLVGDLDQGAQKKLSESLITWFSVLVK